MSLLTPFRRLPKPTTDDPVTALRTSIGTLADALEAIGVSVFDFGAIGDGTYHPLSERYATLAEAQDVYPHAIALTDSIDWAAIQAAIDAVDKYNAVTGLYSPPRGGVVFLPLATYWINRSLYTDARIRLVGLLGNDAGGRSSRITADPAGDYTNGAYAEKFMLKMGRRSTGNYWWHSGSLENLQLDCNQAPGLGGYHCWGSGENSWIHNVRVINSGWTDRTVTDVVFTAGSKVITSASGAFTQDDVGGRATPNDATGFPTSWSNVHLTAAAWNKGSDRIIDAGMSSTSADLGKQVCWNTGTSGGWPQFVEEIVSGTEIRVSHPMRDTKTAPQSLWLRQPRGLRIERVVNGTTAWLTQKAVSSGSGGSVTFRRPRPGVRYDSGNATMLLGSLNVSNNSGPGLEVIGNTGGGEILSLTGDNNAFLWRLRDCGSAGDPSTFNASIKAENNSYGSGDLQTFADHDPVVLIDGPGMVHLNLRGHAHAGDRGTEALVRIGRKGGSAVGYPSVTIQGIEGADPYNTEFDAYILDTDTGRRCPTPAKAASNLFNDFVLWNRRLITSDDDNGGVFSHHEFLSTVRRATDEAGTNQQHVGTSPWHQSRRFWNVPPTEQHAAGGGFWNWTTNAAVLGGAYGYNGTPTLGDDYRWAFALSKGTWSFAYHGAGGNNFGIITWDISFDNGSTWTAIGTHDLYNAAATVSAASTFTGIVVPTSGKALLRAQVLGKNAAALTPFYFMGLAFGDLVRTA